MEERERLLQLLRTRALREGKITLSSGKVSDYYVDAREVVLHPEGAYLTGRLLLDMIDPEVAAVAGMTLGADPIVTAVSIVGHIEGRDLSALIIRKEAKGHGTGKFVEGPSLPRGSKVTVVDDVVTTGSSLIKSIERLKNEGYQPVQVLTILDREEGGKERLAEIGYALKSIFTRSDLIGEEPSR